jgi:hypothetical protein
MMISQSHQQHQQHCGNCSNLQQPSHNKHRHAYQLSLVRRPYRHPFEMVNALLHQHQTIVVIVMINKRYQQRMLTCSCQVCFGLPLLLHSAPI